MLLNVLKDTLTFRIFYVYIYFLFLDVVFCQKENYVDDDYDDNHSKYHGHR
jgi:hypothetical protein